MPKNTKAETAAVVNMPHHIWTLLSALEKSSKLLNSKHVSVLDLMSLHAAAKQDLLELAPQLAKDPYFAQFFKS